MLNKYAFKHKYKKNVNSNYFNLSKNVRRNMIFIELVYKIW